MQPKRLVTPALPAYAGLELISAAVLVTDVRGGLLFMNTSAEDLFAVSAKSVASQACNACCRHARWQSGVVSTHRIRHHRKQDHQRQRTESESAAGALHLHCAASVTPLDDGRIVIELAARDQAWRIAREERILERQGIESRVAAESGARNQKNPLGGIRGAAQLLARELASVPSDASLQEYTDVIVKEAGRLQALMDRCSRRTGV